MNERAMMFASLPMRGDPVWLAALSELERGPLSGRWSTCRCGALVRGGVFCGARCRRECLQALAERLAPFVREVVS